jgi:hypothetical protein
LLVRRAGVTSPRRARRLPCCTEPRPEPRRCLQCPAALSPLPHFFLPGRALSPSHHPPLSVVLPLSLCSLGRKSIAGRCRRTVALMLRLARKTVARRRPPALCDTIFPRHAEPTSVEFVIRRPPLQVLQLVPSSSSAVHFVLLRAEQRALAGRLYHPSLVPPSALHPPAKSPPPSGSSPRRCCVTSPWPQRLRWPSYRSCSRAPPQLLQVSPCRSTVTEPG